VDTAKRDEQKDWQLHTVAQIRTRDGSLRFDFVLVTAGREGADHIMVQLQPDPPFSMLSLAVDKGRAKLLIITRLRG
jgi:hypothetical protein